MSAAEPTYRLSDLAFLDADLAERVENALKDLPQPLPARWQSHLIDDAIWGLSQETSFGRAIADGYLTLFYHVGPPLWEHFRRMVRRAGRKGPSLGWVMATYLATVLCLDDADLVMRFNRAVDRLVQKGAYTLRPALECLPALCADADTTAAAAYLDVLDAVFGCDLTYSQSQHFSHTLPKAAMMFAEPKRSWQLGQLIPLVKTDVLLAKAYLTGMEKGLRLLTEPALKRFVASGIDKHRRRPLWGQQFMALTSKAGQDGFAELQVGVSLPQVKAQLNRYLRARTGRSIALKAISQLPQKGRWSDGPDLLVCSDGDSIFLADDIEWFESRCENHRLYKCLVRFESAYFEFGTFEFDLQRLQDRCSAVQLPSGCETTLSDLERFLSSFSLPSMAEDLFLLFEHRRVHRALKERYPGLMRQYLPMLQSEAQRLDRMTNGPHWLSGLYRHFVLEMPATTERGFCTSVYGLLADLETHLMQSAGEDCVETSAASVVRYFNRVHEIWALAHTDNPIYRPMPIPFGRRIYPDLVHFSRHGIERLARQINSVLELNGVHLYTSLIRRHIQEQRAVLDRNRLSQFIRDAHRTFGGATPAVEEISRWLAGIEGLEHPQGGVEALNANGREQRHASWYWEWDCDAQDYRPDHVRVCDRLVEADGDAFYADTLDRHYGMVARIRRAFELIKPEGLKRLRRWVEGDDFDYRALLDHAVDRRAGLAPSDRLYIKRVKRQREVAVLLLVDLSRSTGNLVAGTSDTVLDIEKEAIVLFAEALQVVGDEYAISGYSGTGRQGVDYFRIKAFQEALGADVKSRIGALTPQRNTRMGGAIRHSATLFKQTQAHVRLLVLLGDGYPNDTDYKKDYAYGDTYKAIAELRSQNIHVHAITVNLQGAAGAALDTVFGNVHHTLISDVTELPNKLVNIYGTLTRY